MYADTKVSEEHTASNFIHLLHPPEDGGVIFLRNIGDHLQDYMVSQSDNNLNAHCCENLKCHITGIWFSLKFLHEITLKTFL
jgi:hypothetical protein